MTDKNVTNLIDKLSSDLTPVNVHWSAEKRSFTWVAVHCLWISLVGFITNYNAGFSLSSITYRSHLYLELTLFFIAIVIASFTSFASLVPGRRNEKSDIILSLIAPVILFLLVLFKVLFTKGHMLKMPMAIGCELQIFLYSLVPIFHLYYMIRNSEANYSKFTFLSMGIASASIPSLLMHVVCMGDYKHVLIYHLGAIGAIALITPFAMKKALNK